MPRDAPAGLLLLHRFVRIDIVGAGRRPRHLDAKFQTGQQLVPQGDGFVVGERGGFGGADHITASATLGHCASYARQHPEQLFQILTGLAGGLMTFSRKHALADLPAYCHDDPAPGFGKLDYIIRDLVDTVLLSRYFPIELEIDPYKSTHYRATLDAARVGMQTALCLAVNADMPALELVAVVPLQFKISAPDQIDQLVARALPGAGLRHMAQVPAEVPVRPSTYYFAIENKGALHEAMIRSQAIAIYVPSGIQGLKLELFGISAAGAG